MYVNIYCYLQNVDLARFQIQVNKDKRLDAFRCIHKINDFYLTPHQFDALMRAKHHITTSIRYAQAKGRRTEILLQCNQVASVLAVIAGVEEEMLSLMV